MQMKAYIQGDWEAANVVPGAEDPKAEYRRKLLTLAGHGIVNTATWHDEAVGVEPAVKLKNTDVIRNCAQVDEAEIVITLATRLDPPYKHWGSLAMIAYAVGNGKPCYVICTDDNVLLRSHFINHPKIRHFTSLEHFLDWWNR